ncbi:MAG: hypothetical protein Q9221_003038 [Calogaya cf. arnoldii]
MAAPTEPCHSNGNGDSIVMTATTSLEQYDNIYFRDNPIVELKVGAEASLFHIHRGLICESSPFFRAAFTGRFKESCGSISLGEDDADVFGHIVQWLYRGKLETLSKTEADTGDDYFMKLFQLYVLADKYAIVPLENAVMDLLFGALDRRGKDLKSKIHRPPQEPHITYVYENSPQGSQLRRFIMVYYVWHINLDWYNENTTVEWLESNPSFGADVVKVFAARAKGEPSPFSKIKRSSFQVSVEDQPQA